MLSFRSTLRPLVSLRLATLFCLEKELGVLTDEFESSRSFFISQPPHRGFSSILRFCSNLDWVGTVRKRTVPSLRRPNQLPDSLPDELSPSEDDFFSSVPGLNCFNPASLREVSPLRVQPLLLAHLSLATLICLEQECDIAATPCSPFGPGRALLPFPSQGRFQLQYPPSHGSLTTHCCVVN